ncbi:hypothetical protein ACMYSQ_006678 [Aspergillus niger]
MLLLASILHYLSLPLTPSHFKKMISIGLSALDTIPLSTRIPLAGPLSVVDVSCPAMSTEDLGGHLHGRWKGHDNRKWKLMNYAYEARIIEAQGPSRLLCKL